MGLRGQKQRSQRRSAGWLTLQSALHPCRARSDATDLRPISAACASARPRHTDRLHTRRAVAFLVRLFAWLPGELCTRSAWRPSVRRDRISRCACIGPCSDQTTRRWVLATAGASVPFSSSPVCAAPSLWSLPGRWHATAFGVSPSSVCPVSRRRPDPRQATTARAAGGASTCWLLHI